MTVKYINLLNGAFSIPEGNVVEKIAFFNKEADLLFADNDDQQILEVIGNRFYPNPSGDLCSFIVKFKNRGNVQFFLGKTGILEFHGEEAQDIIKIEGSNKNILVEILYK